MAFFRGPNIVRDGLVLALDAGSQRSYPGSGTTWYDLSDNGINGTLSNSGMGTTTPGVMTLDQSLYSLSFGHNSLLEPPNITVEAWINLSNIGDRHILITKWYGWSFEIGANTYPYFRINGSAVYDITASNPISWGNWCHIASTFDDVNNIRYIYVNGLYNSISDTGSISYSQGTFNIPYVNNPGYGKGKIAILRIYDRALSINEVLQNYNAQKSRFGL